MNENNRKRRALSMVNRLERKGFESEVLREG
jgi:hypothetical protein